MRSVLQFGNTIEAAKQTRGVVLFCVEREVENLKGAGKKKAGGKKKEKQSRTEGVRLTANMQV